LQGGRRRRGEGLGVGGWGAVLLCSKGEARPHDAHLPQLALHNPRAPPTCITLLRFRPPSAATLPHCAVRGAEAGTGLSSLGWGLAPHGPTTQEGRPHSLALGGGEVGHSGEGRGGEGGLRRGRHTAGDYIPSAKRHVARRTAGGYIWQRVHMMVPAWYWTVRVPMMAPPCTVYAMQRSSTNLGRQAGRAQLLQRLLDVLARGDALQG
jgi:hypothetical protein